MNKNIAYQNQGDAVKAQLKGKHMSLKAYIGKEV